MSPVAKSLIAFGCYLFPLGLILLLVPNLLLGLFQIPATSEVWIRVVGMLVIFLGVTSLLHAPSCGCSRFNLETAVGRM